MCLEGIERVYVGCLEGVWGVSKAGVERERVKCGCKCRRGKIPEARRSFDIKV